MTDFDRYMNIAIEEAEASLRGGNSGFGAVIVKDGDLVARAHDTDTTDGDPTAHAEMKVIRLASAVFGKDLSGCVIISTHEPCPMCSTAMFWSGINEIAFGCSIKESLKQGRKRLDISIEEIFSRGGREIIIHENILHAHCSILYNRAVRDEIKALRSADENRLKELAAEKLLKRLEWFDNNRTLVDKASPVLDEAYKLFIRKFGIAPEEAAVVSRDNNRLIIHSRNFCPTLEACRILKMDTRFVCRHLTENATTGLLRQLNPKLSFARNYDKIRPYAAYCEEMIILEDQA